MSKLAVWRWWDRFLAEGVDGLPRDASRPPGKKPIAEDRVKAAIDLAMSPPAHARLLDGAGTGDADGMAVSTMHGIPRGTASAPEVILDMTSSNANLQVDILLHRI